MAKFKTAIDEMLERALNLSEDAAWDWVIKKGTDIPTKVREFINQQLEEGVDEFDSIIGYYSPENKRLKGRDTYNLVETGAFTNSITVRLNTQGITTDADAQKDDDNLFTKHGIGIIGLNDFHMEELIEIIMKLYYEYLQNTLFTR